MPGSETLSADRLTMLTAQDGVWVPARATAGLSAGKWYWEMSSSVAANARYAQLGISNDNWSKIAAMGDASYSGSAVRGTTLGPAWGAALPAVSTTDTIMVALDMDAKTLTLGKNGQWGSGPNSLATSFEAARPYVIGVPDVVYPFGQVSYRGTVSANFGATPFSYSPPAGFHKGVWQP